MSDATQHGISSYLPDEKEKRKGTAFCMSGGGYRAALFHLGALRRLNELGLLASIDTFTSVSGGSIMASQLATFMAGAKREPGKPVDGFDEGVAEPMRAFAGKDVRTGAAHREAATARRCRARRSDRPNVLGCPGGGQ